MGHQTRQLIVYEVIELLLDETELSAWHAFTYLCKGHQGKHQMTQGCSIIENLNKKLPRSQVQHVTEDASSSLLSLLVTGELRYEDGEKFRHRKTSRRENGDQLRWLTSVGNRLYIIYS